MLPVANILKDSLKIWVKNYTLVYGLLIVLFVFTWVLPEQIHFSQVFSSQKGLLMVLSVVLVWSALLAGWLNMIKTSCDNYYALEPAERNKFSFEKSFRLFSAFFPGISQFFLPVFVGLAVQLVAGYWIFQPLVPLWIKLQPLTERILAVDFRNTDTLLTLFTASEKALLQTFSVQWLLSTAEYGLLLLLFLLWPAYVVVRQQSPLQAFWLSLKQYFRMPLTMGLMVLLMVSFVVALYVVTAITTMVAMGSTALISFLLMFIQLIGMMVIVFFTIMLFVYVHQHGDKEPVTLASSSTSASGAEKQEKT